jgi:outer membrane protein OmpA-like peptidoglycan-associated protein
VVQRRVTLFVCTVVPIIAACATKGYVREQVGATQVEMTRQSEAQDAKLQESARRAVASRQLIEAASERIQGLDTRVRELDTAAGDARSRAGEAQDRADQAAAVARAAEARLSQRIADRNKYRLLETRFIYFESGRADIRDAGIAELEEVAKALQADPNALVELQSFADPRGGDRYNDDLARQRAEAVIRQLVRRYGIDLHQIRAIAMGKVALAPGEKPSADVLANARRVEIRLLAPWSSWEDTHAGTSTLWPSASVIQEESREAGNRLMAPVGSENGRGTAESTSDNTTDEARTVRRVLEDQRRMMLDDGNPSRR